jgi:hypothetical protein
MSEPKFTGIWIPKAIFQHPELSTSAKLLYGVVAGLDGEDGCYASNAYLQAVLGASERAVQGLLAELDGQGLIQREDYRGKRVIRTVESIALGGCKKLRGGVKKSAGEGCKNLHPYNKDNNKEDKDTRANAPWVVKLPFESEAFSKAWLSWIAYRKEIKKPIKESTIKAQWGEFAKWGEQKSIIAIQQSITHGWQGLFEPARSVGGNTNTLTSKDHDSF